MPLAPLDLAWLGGRLVYRIREATWINPCSTCCARFGMATRVYYPSALKAPVEIPWPFTPRDINGNPRINMQEEYELIRGIQVPWSKFPLIQPNKKDHYK